MCENPSFVLELTEEEKDLLSQIYFHPLHSPEFQAIIRVSCAAAAQLASSLLSRKAIPEMRLRYFNDPNLNIGSKKSRKQVFEANGTYGNAILEHAHFLPYLQYFIFGPQLPSAIINGFCDLISSPYNDLVKMRQFSRNAFRQFDLNPREACEEFFKLALECGLDPSYARSIRDAVRTAR
jgi:hypothetical protein